MMMARVDSFFEFALAFVILVIFQRPMQRLDFSRTIGKLACMTSTTLMNDTGRQETD
jgi:uncharacterized membrane protein YjjB (DUF3815 family)